MSKIMRPALHGKHPQQFRRFSLALFGDYSSKKEISGKADVAVLRTGDQQFRDEMRVAAVRTYVVSRRHLRRLQQQQQRCGSRQ